MTWDQGERDDIAGAPRIRSIPQPPPPPPPPPPPGFHRRGGVSDRDRTRELRRVPGDDDRYFRDTDSVYFETIEEDDLYYDYDRVLDRNRAGTSPGWDSEEVPPSTEQDYGVGSSEPEVTVIGEYIPPSKAYQSKEKDRRIDASKWV